MGVEVEESNLPVVSEEVEVPAAAAAEAVPEAVSDESNLSNENGKADDEVVVENNVPITFGSHGVDEPVKEETVKPSAEVSNFPKDAVDEWPAAPQIYPHYIMKYRQFEDPKIKAKLEQADLELTKKNQARSQLIDKLRGLRGERAQKSSLLRALYDENNQYSSVLGEKKKVRDPLQQALGTLGGKGSNGICSSEKELDSLLKSMQYRIEHETIPLKEEKLIMREMKQLEATRPQVKEIAAQREKIKESMGEKIDLQKEMDLLKVDMDGVRKEQQTVFAKILQLKEEITVIDKKIKAVEEELDELTKKKDTAYQSIVELRKQRDEVNSAYYQNRSLLNEIRSLGFKKDVAGVAEKAQTEFANWISQYGAKKSFREDYVKRMPSSLDSRNFTADGRSRNFDEKPILVVEKVTPPETEAVSRSLPKQAPPPKDNAVAPTPAAAAVEKEKSGKAQKEPNKASKASAAPKAVDEADDEPDFYMPEKKQSVPPKVDEVDEAKLKEMKREQEIAKAKLALEKKKKQAEKAAAKAAIRAQKEAEKKQKALEKKEKKKAGVSVEEPKETEAAAAEEVAESDKSAAEETVETTAAASKNRNRKANNTPMKRRVRPRGPDSLPKTLLKRKKATNYWMWAAPAGAAITVLLAAVGYYFLN